MASTEALTAIGFVSRIAALLATPVSGLSLAVFRIALGGMLVWDCWRFFKYNRIFRYYVQPDFHFTYPGFGWVQPLPEPWIYLAWGMVGFFGALVMLGLFYRFSIIALTIIFTYFFLLDKVEYLNHFYLIILLLIMFCALPAERCLSLDARRRGASSNGHVPYVAVFAVRAQMEIVLLYAGFVKLTPDWLAGEPLGMWLRKQSDEHIIGPLFHYDLVILAGTWGTVALHIIGAPLLLWRRTRLVVFFIYCAFHMANAAFFPIGIFPWLTIAATTIFFDPDWPRQAARWLHARFEPVAGPEPTAPPRSQPLSRLALLALSLWLLVQIALPLRANLYDSEVRWSGEGHRYSWRMRIYDRDTEATFFVTAGENTWEVQPAEVLGRRPARKMSSRPDMIHQFAQRLESLWRQHGYEDVIVRAEILKSLNGRPSQLFIDPSIDLTEVEYNQFETTDWILPLKEPVWGVAQNRERK